MSRLAGSSRLTRSTVDVLLIVGLPPSTPRAGLCVEMGTAAPRRRYWRLYRTSLDHRVIRDELLALPREAYAEVKGAMDDVEDLGLQTSKRLRNEIRDIDAGDPTQGTTYRLLFNVDGREGQILLGLVFFNKKTKTPPRYIDLAEKRLADWRSRRQQHEASKL